MIIAASLFGALLLTLAARYWRFATWAALVLMIYEGALRKWFLPQFQEHIYFLKDLLLLGAYVGCFFGSRVMRSRPLFQRHSANLIIGVYALFCTLQVLNPRLPNWMVGLYGCESYLFYIPLMYMVPELLPDEKTFRRFVIALLIVSAAPLLLGAVQFDLPADHVLNRYAWSTQTVATFGANYDRARVTSTFSYITGYAVYLTGLGVLLLALALAESRRLVRILLYVALFFTVADMLMTGSRSPIVQFAVTAPLAVLLTMGSATNRHVRAALATILVVAIVGYAVVAVFPAAHEAFTDRVVANGSENFDRITQLWTGTVNAIHAGGVDGYGIGSTLPASSFLYDQVNAPDPPPWVEAELEHVAVETGVIGLLLTIMVRLLLSVQLYRSIQEFPRSGARPLLAAACVFVLINLPMQIIVSRTAGLMYWFMAGFAFLPRRWLLSQAQFVEMASIPAEQAVPAIALRRGI
jgi:O-Antigen ligase